MKFTLFRKALNLTAALCACTCVFLCAASCKSLPEASHLPAQNEQPEPSLTVISEDFPGVTLSAEETTAYIDAPLDLNLPDPPYYAGEEAPETENPPELAVVEKTEVEEPAVVAEEPPPKEEPATKEEPPAVPLNPTPKEVPATAPTTTPPAPPAQRPAPPLNVTPSEKVVNYQPPQPAVLTKRSAAKLPAETVSAEKPAPSRTVRLHAGQMLEVPFTGTGWVYLGENGLKQGINFDSRKLDSLGQTFLFKPESPGNYTLNFSKHDFYNGYEIEDSVLVVVYPSSENEFDAGTRVAAAPRWPPNDYNPSSPPQLPAKPSGAASAPPETADFTPAAASGVNASGDLNAYSTERFFEDENTDSLPQTEELDEEAVLKEAEAAYNSGDISGALESLAKLGETADWNDKALYLQGKSFEAAGPLRNIKKSMAAYSSITNNFPQSIYYEEAAKRIAYLNKFYFNIK
ncbi:MAG: hypothetical protein LBC53_01835 [Spirochaetaceae bacterium]|nr:hypothetical protein [Spirochaetaceae bacterium]